MSKFEFIKLDDDGLRYLESDPEVKLRYLDFITFLEDLLSIFCPGLEPATEDSGILEAKLYALVPKLPRDANIRSVASKNLEQVMELFRNWGLSSEGHEFREGLLHEYNVVRLMRSRGGATNRTNA